MNKARCTQHVKVTQKQLAAEIMTDKVISFENKPIWLEGACDYFIKGKQRYCCKDAAYIIQVEYPKVAV
jgi:hypothetical protein